MNRSHVLLALSIATLIGVVAYRFVDNRREPGESVLPKPVSVDDLEALLDVRRKDVSEAVEPYQPAMPVNLLDPAADLPAILRGLPYVRSVEVTGAGKPRLTIIHLRDWHMVDRKLLDKFDGKHTDDDFAKEQLRIELVQIEQRAILECLFRHHDLRNVLVEGLTEERMPDLKKHIQTLQTFRQIEGEAAPEDLETMQEIRRQLGVALQLKADGLLDVVWPLDREKELQDSDPAKKGPLRIDFPENQAREKAMIELCRVHEPLAVIILGGRHRLAGDGVQVIRVTTVGYPMRLSCRAIKKIEERCSA